MGSNPTLGFMKTYLTFNKFDIERLITGCQTMLDNTLTQDTYYQYRRLKNKLLKLPTEKVTAFDLIGPDEEELEEPDDYA